MRRALITLLVSTLCMPLAAGCAKPPAALVEQVQPSSIKAREVGEFMKPRPRSQAEGVREERVGAQAMEAVRRVQPAQPVQPPPDPAADPQEIPATGIAGACSDFDLALLGQVVAANPASDVVLSPFSVRMALAMAYNGAEGAARDAIAAVCDFKGMGLEGVNRLMRDVLLALRFQDEKVQLEMANSIWGQNGLRFYDELIGACRDFYQAELQRVDFKDPETVRIINAWADDTTHGKIPEIVPDHQAIRESRFAIMNAVYLKAAWASQFKEDLTQEDDFILPGGERIKVPLMRQSAQFAYLENEDFQAVRLPYGDGRLGMYVFLPREGKDLAGLCASLNSESWESWIGAFEPREGTVYLPRFEVEYGADLKPVLQAMGMGPAFEGNALPKVYETTDPVAITVVLHKAVIEVNEEGTEGAAVTYVGIGPTCAPRAPTDPFIMEVNRPFFFAVRDDSTGAILFMGSIVDPS